MWTWRYCLCSIYCQCVPEVWALGWPSGMPQLRSRLYPYHGNQLGHLTCPAKGSERRYFGRVKLMEAFRSNLGDMACGDGTRGWWRSAGGAGWAALSGVGEPVLPLHLGFLGKQTLPVAGNISLPDQESRKCSRIPEYYRIWLIYGWGDWIQWHRWCFLVLCPPACTSPVLTFFFWSKRIIVVLFGLSLTQFSCNQIFISVGYL